MPRTAKALFTVIVDYRGGTYTYQVRAHDVVGALRFWAKTLNPAEVTHFGEARKQKLIAQIADDLAEESLPVPLNELQNVWCKTQSCGGHLMLINLIKTAEPREGWTESYREMAARGDDKLIDPPASTEFDEEEWKW